MGTRTGNPTWEDSPSTNTLITAARLNAIEAALDAPPTLPVGLFTDRQYMLSINNGAWCQPEPGFINIAIIDLTSPRPVKKLVVEVSTTATQETLIEYAFYDAYTLTQVVTMGTVNTVGTGTKTLTLATAVPLPAVVILAQRLRSPARNGATLKSGKFDGTLNPGLNPWDSLNDLAQKPYGLAVAGYDALPATLPSTGWASDVGSPLPWCSMMAK